jgi:hypothetical protein
MVERAAAARAPTVNRCANSGNGSDRAKGRWAVSYGAMHPDDLAKWQHDHVFDSGNVAAA